MEQFIGAKIVHAKPGVLPMASHEQPGYEVHNPANHVNWTPKEDFERYYRPVTAMTFGLAMEAIRHGDIVRRRAWSDTTRVYMESNPDRTPRDTILMKVLWEPRWQVYEWQPSQLDMISQDWMIVTPEQNRAMELQGTSLKSAN